MIQIKDLKRVCSGGIVGVFALLLGTMHSTQAQYYSWGADPASLKWESITMPNAKLIYPDTVDALARRTQLYLESIQKDIGYGFRYPAMDVPFVMHAENFASNGMVMWLPKRIEFLTSPAIGGYSMPWIKQLVAHEYRHAVQYNNLNRSWIKALSYILGEQGSAAGLLFLPLYVLEGDAVMIETQMSSFGRAFQPSFTMGYRAIGRDMLTKKNFDKWRCGSYKEYIPDHYELGYQSVSYAYTRYGDDVWDKVTRYSVRNPYFIFTTSMALNKYYDTDSEGLARDAFAELFDLWDSLPEREESPEIIIPIDSTNYTTYSYPMGYDKGVVSLKSDYKRASRFVMNREGEEEQKIAYTGVVSTRPSLGDDKLFWSEYRRSTLFQQRVNSQLCYMDLKDGKSRSVRGLRKTLYPAVVDESTGHIAYVEYSPSGLFSIVEVLLKPNQRGRYRAYEELSRTPITFPTELHGLAWDDKSRELYFIATDDSGMWLGKRSIESKNGYEALQTGAYITLSDLRAKDGVLYYGSIESGYDELHSFDIASGVERRITESKYGSFDASTPNDGVIYATTYNRYGYQLSKFSSESDFGEVERKSLPQNIVNAKRVDWNLINLDTVRFSAADTLALEERAKSKRYSKPLNLLKAHSWMPFATNPFELLEESRIYAALGVTVVSQNLLSSAEGYASYSYNSTEGSLLSGGLKYDGLGVELEASATYGGNQIVYDPFNLDFRFQQKYYSVSTSASLPLLFPCGYHTRQLTPYVSWSYSNGMVIDLDTIEYDAETNTLTNNGTIGFNEGLQKLAFGLGYSDYVQSAHRDLITPFGYSISASYALSPDNSYFSNLMVLYGKVVTRGLLPHNSITLSACYQNSFGGYKINGINLFSFQSSALLPTGFSTSDIINHNYAALSLKYQFPLCYPEGGIGSILYFKRIRLGLGADGARFNDYSDARHMIYSYGGSLILDLNPFSMPESGTTAVELSLYRNSENDLSFQFGFALPF